MGIQEARFANSGLILRAFVASGATTRQQIGEATGLSKATVSRVVRRLVDAGTVVEGALTHGPGGGRATQTLEFRGGDELVCGVDMGGTNTRLVVVDQRGRPVASWRVLTAHLDSGAQTADWLAAELRAGCPDVARRSLVSTVVGVPGVVAPASGEVQQVPNLVAIGGTSFARRLEERLPGLVALENDANLALVGEMGAGAAAGLQDVAMVTIGTGVGAGVALHGELLTGARGLVGEFGSLPLDSTGATVEEALSGAALATARTSLGASDGPLPLTPGPDDDADRSAARARVVGAVHALTVAMAVAYDLEMVVFGGHGSAQLSEALEQVRKRLATGLPAAPELVMSRLGDAAGALGAVAMALEVAQRRLGAGAGLNYASALGGELRELAPVVVAALEHGPDPRGEPRADLGADPCANGPAAHRAHPGPPHRSEGVAAPA